ncbi:hypothetical protein GA0070607_2572 [Micromonospora coriariae]|uniref:Uncharacterized protein n=1 Tax=Micromonospora coriariae TaxID=285665 RepID=A0A1C4VSM9_9ACTN|nr:hypothetical protein GA0070607_2572 [Micromonospora coriariae]
MELGGSAGVHPTDPPIHRVIHSLASIHSRYPQHENDSESDKGIQ